MATYEELYGLKSSDTLRNKIAIAVMVKAEAIRTEDGGIPNHSNRLLWAKQVFEASDYMAKAMLLLLLVQNKDSDVSVIDAATDVTIQNAVDGAVDLFATG